jgi:hypothetical protein
LLVFIGDENVGINLLNKIISYKKIENFALGVCFRNDDLYIKLKNLILDNFIYYALFISKEYGNDIMPTLMMYNKINDFLQFEFVIKLHTKSSDIKWYNDTTDFLLNKKINELINCKTNLSNCVGPKEYYSKINAFDNINTIKIYSNYINKEYFVRGTIFFCEKKVIDKIISLISIDYKLFFNNNLYDTNFINRTNSPIHSLERFFGIIKI